MDKKAQELVVKWLLVILIGAVIIIFGVFFSQRVGKSETYKRNIALSEYVDLLFNPLSSIGAIASGTSKEVKLSAAIPLEVSCRADREFVEIGEGEQKATQGLEDKFIFSPTRLNSEKLYIFSRPFNLPFRVADLIYVFPSQQNYCFIYDDSSEEFVFNLLDEMKSEFENSDARRNFIACSQESAATGCCLTNSRKIAFFDSGADGADGADVTVIDESGGGFGYGSIKTGTAGTGDRKTFFVGKELVLAAAFSDSYACNLARVMKRTSLVSQVYAKKSKLLEQTQECSYQNIRDALNVLISQSSNPVELYDASRELEEENSKLNCAQVF